MQLSVLLLLASVVLAYNMHTAEAKFRFSLPTTWGSAKRFTSYHPNDFLHKSNLHPRSPGFALPGKWGASAKRGGPFSFSLPGRWGNAKRSYGAPLSCDQYDPEAVTAIYTILQHEGERLAECMANKPTEDILEEENMTINKKH